MFNNLMYMDDILQIAKNENKLKIDKTIIYTGKI